MSQFANILVTICTAIAPYTYALAAVALLACGVMFIIPSDRTQQMAIKALPYIIVGSIFVIGAVSLGKWIGSQITF